jgi:hypothetical protein
MPGKTIHETRAADKGSGDFVDRSPPAQEIGKTKVPYTQLKSSLQVVMFGYYVSVKRTFQ